MNTKSNCLFSIPVLGLLVIWGLSWTMTVREASAVQNWHSPTPEPTLTNTEQAEFEAYILDELQSAFGFEHPIFEELAEDYGQSRPDYIRRLQDGLFEVTITMTRFADYRYVVGNMPGSSFIGYHYTLFFRVDLQGNVTELTPKLSLPRGYAYVGLTDLSYMPESGQIVSDGFADRNQNQRPDLPLFAYTGGNCCPRYMLLLELNAQGEFVDITPDHTDVSPAYFYDLDQDGGWEIQGVSTIFNAVSSFRPTAPQLVRWFAWDGSQYVEATTQYQDWFQHRIDPFLEYLSDQEYCVPLPRLEFDTINIYQVLLDYYVIGRLDAGWEEIQRRANWSECRPQLAGQYESEIAAFDNWLLSLRNGTLIDKDYSPVLAP